MACSELSEELAVLTGWKWYTHDESGPDEKWAMYLGPDHLLTGLVETNPDDFPEHRKGRADIPQPDTDAGDCMDLICAMASKQYGCLQGPDYCQVLSWDDPLVVFQKDHDGTPTGIMRAVCEAARDALSAQKEQGG